jgi:hypothetical protein
MSKDLSRWTLPLRDFCTYDGSKARLDAATADCAASSQAVVFPIFLRSDHVEAFTHCAPITATKRVSHQSRYHIKLAENIIWSLFYLVTTYHGSTKLVIPSRKNKLLLIIFPPGFCRQCRGRPMGYIHTVPIVILIGSMDG